MPDYIRAGLYYKNLKPYFDNFNSEQIHIIMFDDYKKNGRKVLKDLYEFLGVDISINVDLTKKYNITGQSKSKILSAVLFSVSRLNWIKQWVPRNIYEYLKDKLHRLRSHNIIKSRPMTEAERRFISEYFLDDISELEKLLKKDLSLWR